MTLPSLTWAQIKALDPCPERRDAVRRKLVTKFADYDTRSFTMADAASAGVDLNDLLWVASAAAERHPDCARRLRLFAADCAAHVSHLAPDPRSRAAITAARGFARGTVSEEELGAARDAAAYVADAAAAAYAASAARYAERSWQLARLLAWFSEEEPEDWPIKEEDAA